jgi:hypothetical protein
MARSFQTKGGIESPVRIRLVVAFPAVVAGLLVRPVGAQDFGFDFTGYYLNVGTASLSGPFTPEGATDLQRLRLGIAPSLGTVSLEVAYEQTLRLYTDPSIGALPYGSVGIGESRTPWLPLQGTIAESNHALWSHRVDRLAVRVPVGEHLELSAGRQAVSWATTLFLTPADPFAPFDPADPFRDYRAGVDVLRARVFAGAFTELDAVVNPSEVGDESDLTALLRVTTIEGAWEMGGWAGVIHDRAGAALSATLTTGGTAFRAEMTVRDEPDDIVWRAALGADRNVGLAGRDLYLALEYQFDGFGAGSGEELVQTVLSDAWRRGELQVLGRHETALQATWQAGPLLTLEWLSLWNLSDGSLLLSPAASVSLSNEITGRAGVFLGIGSQTRSVATPRPGTAEILPASEYGIVPGSLYLSVTAFF